jgi:hypothetical protein
VSEEKRREKMMDLGTYMCSLNALDDAKSPCSNQPLEMKEVAIGWLISRTFLGCNVLERK